ncbi:predicted protein [Nematostella vectensis]|uniref:G-protein coupled receptors family 1 profile domain-containing protein n=2 Tax=Nematostella vectensis TaxID=45351 RepID=A7S7C9_NEMVE|nr:predicted protein [Nematostella vectensis]|eukprot:XP_001632441.1 predicted protein [Nematostella vectensis]
MDGNISSMTRHCFFLVYDSKRILLARDAYIAAAVINCITLLPAIILNVLLMMAMYRSPAFRKPSTLLLYSLSSSDLLIGLIVQPAYIAKKVGELTDNFNLYCQNAFLIYNFGKVLTGVSFLTLTLISVDRYLLVTSGIDYPTKVTNYRVGFVIALSWLFMIAIIITQHFIPNRATVFILIALLIGSCVAITTICYVMALHKIRRQKNAIRLASGPRSQLQANTARYKKFIITMIWVFVVFLLCYTPYMVATTLAAVIGETASIWSAESLCGVIAYSHSCLNPAILFWRMAEIRNAGKNILMPKSKIKLKDQSQISIPDKTVETIPKFG